MQKNVCNEFLQFFRQGMPCLYGFYLATSASLSSQIFTGFSLSRISGNNTLNNTFRCPRPSFNIVLCKCGDLHCKCLSAADDFKPPPTNRRSIATVINSRCTSGILFAGKRNTRSVPHLPISPTNYYLISLMPSREQQSPSRILLIPNAHLECGRDWSLPDHSSPSELSEKPS